MLNNNQNTQQATKEKNEAERIETIMNFDELDDGSDPNADLYLLKDAMHTPMKMGSKATSSEMDSSTQLHIPKPDSMLNESLSPSLSWVRDVLREEAISISPHHLSVLTSFEQNCPKLWLATIELIQTLILDDLGLDVADHPDFEKKFKGCLVKVELEINCNQLPTIYYFEDSTLQSYAWALMDLDYFDERKIGDYIFFKHLSDDTPMASMPNLDLESSIDPNDDSVYSSIHKNLEKSIKKINENSENPLAQEILSNFKANQKKLEAISLNPEFNEFMGFDTDELEKDAEDILFMEIAVMLAQKIVFSFESFVLSIFVQKK